MFAIGSGSGANDTETVMLTTRFSIKHAPCLHEITSLYIMVRIG